MEDNYTDLERLTSESLKLDNRLRRYWNKLAKESLKIAKEKRFDIGIINQEGTSQHEIIIVKNEKEVNAYDLLILSKDKFPTLYRKYNQGLKKHYQLHKRLESLLTKIDKGCY